MINRLRVWWQWRRQGRPRDVLVVTRPGTLVISGSGSDQHLTIDGFGFSGRYLSSPDAFELPRDADKLWNHLIARGYPQQVDNAELGRINTT